MEIGHKEYMQYYGKLAGLEIDIVRQRLITFKLENSKNMDYRTLQILNNEIEGLNNRVSREYESRSAGKLIK